MLSFLRPVLWVSLIPIAAPFFRRPLYALPPILFFLLGFLRVYSVLGTGEEIKEGKGWYVVSTYDWGRGRIVYRLNDGTPVKVRSRDITVLAGDRPAFPRDEIVVRGVLKGDTLRVYEAYVRKGVRWFYGAVSKVLLKRTLSGEQYAFALSVITGVRELKWEVKEAFYRTGTGHILAISGLHVGIIFLALVMLLRFLVPGVYVPVVASAVVWIYAYLVGFLPSVVRAATLLTFFALANLLSRPVKPLNVLALSLLLSLMVKPLWVFSPSLWLSYSAVAGLFVLRGKVGALFGASLFSLPFALKYFGRFALLYVPLNLVVIPLMTAFMYSQILALFLPYPFTYSAAFFYNLLEWIVLKAYSLNLPALHITLNWTAVILYLVLLSLLLMGLRCRTTS